MNTPVSQSNEHPLAQMRPLQLPPEIDTWGLAPGWYIVIAILLVLTLVTIYLLVKRHRNNRYKREALQTLQCIKDEGNASGKTLQQQAQALSTLYRRLALSLYPREQISALQGEAWLRQLDLMSQSDFFTRHEGRILAEAIYRPADNPGFTKAELDTIIERSENIIRGLKHA